MCAWDYGSTISHRETQIYVVSLKTRFDLWNPFPNSMKLGLTLLNRKLANGCGRRETENFKVVPVGSLLAL